jgi:hypothetical protein
MNRAFYRLGAAKSIGRVHRQQQRSFFAKAIYSSFPASLAYYSPRRRSSLFDHREDASRPNDLYQEGLIISKDGLVHPGVKELGAGSMLFSLPPSIA